MIYVHIPFCRSFCTYCDFYSELAAKYRGKRPEQNEVFSRFASALAREIEFCREEVSKEVNTLYIGGGTPSVLPLSVFRTIPEALERIGCGGPYDEFTVEVNPEDIVEKGGKYVEGLMELGVNRISMGIQSFDDRILKFMNRRHDASTAKKAYSIIENAGLDNISIDLIFGLPQLNYVQWSETLEQALDISPKGILPRHISSYQLSVEPGSMLARMMDKGIWTEAPEELCEQQYRMLCDALAKAGYRHYEISNFAFPGFEAKHNSAYWKHIPYIGFGPGAHSYLGNIRRWNKPDLKQYICDHVSVREQEELNEEQLVLEHIMLALRTAEGISQSYLYRHCEVSAVRRAISQGQLVPSVDGHLRIPESKFFISDSIISDLVSGGN